MHDKSNTQWSVDSSNSWYHSGWVIFDEATTTGPAETSSAMTASLKSFIYAKNLLDRKCFLVTHKLFGLPLRWKGLNLTKSVLGSSECNIFHCRCAIETWPTKISLSSMDQFAVSSDVGWKNWPKWNYVQSGYCSADSLELNIRGSWSRAEKEIRYCQLSIRNLKTFGYPCRSDGCQIIGFGNRCCWHIDSSGTGFPRTQRLGEEQWPMGWVSKMALWSN